METAPTTPILDRLPAWARHLVALAVIAPVAIFVTVVATAIVTAGGLSGFDADATGHIALDAAAVSFASGILGWLTLFITPITRQYGVGAPKRNPEDG